MSNEDLLARFSAVESLQTRRNRPAVSQEYQEYAEYAIDLVLNSSRTINGYLAHNAQRDARKILHRKWTKERRFDDIDAFVEPPDSDQPSRLVPWQLINWNDPESICLAEEASERLAESGGDNGLARQCLHLLEMGHTSKDIAQILRVSESTIKRQRVTLCGRLTDIFFGEL